MKQDAMALHIKTFENSDFSENIFVLWRDDAPKNDRGMLPCVVVDPGLEPQEAIRFIQDRPLAVEAILITHGHCDHIAGIDAFVRFWPEAEILIGAGDRPKLTDPEENLSAYFGLPITVRAEAAPLADGQTFTRAGLSLRAIEIPGHSKGHMVYELLETEPPAVFVGDVIFAGSIGRTDFPGGSTRQLLDGIRSKILTFPDDTILYTGHGPATTPGKEKKNNMWL